MSADNIGGVFFAFAALVPATITAELLYEAWALLTKHTPITLPVRASIQAFPKTITFIVFLIGLLAGHFWR